MTWTYSGDPSATSRDQVRFLVGDTDFGKQLVTDEEIAYAVANESTVRMAAVRISRGIAAKFARDVNYYVGDLKIFASARYKQYLEVLKALEADAVIFSATPFAGGISVAGKDSVEDNTDRVKPSFSKGMHDNPGADIDGANYDYDEYNTE
jgi:hypothetical protein